ncbi:outer membrane protein assembly factor BamE [Rhodomicrobium sp. Az07]|uniref:outer membrane protein assembly factor BamE n=1 Tax=Rhodomicrobium sp. Az07 TaxID=2839034 RepID=UPI001BEA6AAE|nr:outer membrane protein assembly factor BamE [Rhodomicrobium sp. Az07]MBT3070608.1 outer membrane protein assembly factor BamE [Rhodomicrobium sp. Az07]
MSNQSSKEFGRKCRRAKTVVRAVAISSALAAGCFMLPGCAGNVIKQGHQFQEEDLNQVRVGMGKDEVVLALGTPDTQSAIAGGTYYYVSQTAQQPMAFMKPEVIDRHVVAVYFDKKDKVEQIANYGLKDGKVFDFIRRETPVYTRDQGMLKEIFRNIGMGPAIPGVQK